MRLYIGCFNETKHSLMSAKRNLSKVFELKNDLLNFTKKNLTTETLAKYTLDCFKAQ